MSAAILGKRKRQDRLKANEESRAPQQDDNDSIEQRYILFRQHFESRFAPLEKSLSTETQVSTPDLTNSSEDAEESDWAGLSDENDEADIQVVDYSTAEKRAEVPKAELKTFMTTKPPSSTTIRNTTTTKPTPPTSTSTPSSETHHLKNDLALQRLLQESSHLLTSSSSLFTSPSSTITLPSLPSRHKMPLSHRRGIDAKKAEKEEKRRREAKENGVVLEVVKKDGAKDKGKEKRRQRGDVGGPGVGRMVGGTLVLKRRDVDEIEGRRGRGGAMGRGRGGGRGGRR